MSVEEYLHTSFPDLDKEFRDGERVDRSMPDDPHSSTQALPESTTTTSNGAFASTNFSPRWSSIATNKSAAPASVGVLLLVARES